MKPDETDRPTGQAGAFWASTPARNVRRGHFWIPGERVSVNGETYQRGPLYAEWEAPAEVTRPWPVVLVHGGGYQGTEWLDTPDGRPGWAQRLVEAGYATLLVDRPGQGRSPFHPETMGPMGPPFSYENGRKIYFPPDPDGKHTQWPFAPGDEAAMDAFIAGYGPLPADLAFSEDMEADRLARLLDQIGPAILLTHSASGPVGWLVADRRPGLVKAIVAIEPMGPPFADIPNIGQLAWGLTASPLGYEPPAHSPEEVKSAAPGALRLPALAGLPVAAVIGETSSFAPASLPIVEMLRAAGAAAELIRLTDHGLTGNGHGLIYEKNSDESLALVLRWLEAHARDPGFATRAAGPPAQFDVGKSPMSRGLRVVAFMRAKPGQESAVREAILACVTPSRAEDGNVSYVAHLDQKDPRLFVVVEHWASAEARDRHLRSPHFKALGRSVDDAGRLSEHVFHVLDPITS